MTIAILTLLSTFLGTGLAGFITHRATKQQIENDRLIRETTYLERQTKGYVSLSWILYQMLLLVDHLEFFIMERGKGLNIYEVNYDEEIKENIAELINLKKRLEQLDVDLFSLEVYEVINKFTGFIFNLQFITKVIVRDKVNNEFQLNKFNSDVALLRELYKEYKSKINKIEQ
ncbi:hypothetical protein F7731_08605 [Cytobacillus depressus]|uniref:DUF4760 domain-containing protein n=1 Tax=Cytobacillus depressus TaxID=1602942 RepID=A0A6L3VA11_9BACI|nr:hypothetical protein [Cytobacillus depressus]KAB2337645.1 hypothetical protein F7731_08605 [Cytobacillus depressus]